MLKHLYGGPGTLATLYPLGIVLALLWIVLLYVLLLVIREENRGAAWRIA